MKLYRVYKHNKPDYNHLYIEIITDQGHYEARKIFTIRWQQTSGEHQYYGFDYEYKGRNTIHLFSKITKQIEKTNEIHYDIQPYELIQTLEKIGYRQCEYYDSIGFTECKKVENKNNFVYNMIVDGIGWTTKLANKNNYKKQIIKNSRFSVRNGYQEVSFKISELNDKIKNTKKFDLYNLHRELVFYRGTEDEKKHFLRKEKLERILE